MGEPFRAQSTALLMDADTPYVPVNEFVAWQARLNSAGHIVNEAAKAFNSGYGTEKHLHAAKAREAELLGLWRNPKALHIVQAA